MNDDAGYAMIFLTMLAAAFGAGVVYAIWSLFQPAPPPPTAEQVWLKQQTERCSSMRSNLNYDEKTRTAECYRTPLMRQPKRMFTERFAD